MLADRRICRTADGKPCEADDPRAAWLVVGGPGQTIPPQLAKQLGLRMDGNRVTWGDEPMEEPEAAEEEIVEDTGLPDGYEMEHHGAGYYTLVTPDGVLMEDDEPVRVRGKQAAIEHFAEWIRAQEE
jgi:hypothetical protein